MATAGLTQGKPGAWPIGLQGKGRTRSHKFPAPSFPTAWWIGSPFIQTLTAENRVREQWSPNTADTAETRRQEGTQTQVSGCCFTLVVWVPNRLSSLLKARPTNTLRGRALQTQTKVAHSCKGCGKKSRRCGKAAREALWAPLKGEVRLYGNDAAPAQPRTRPAAYCRQPHGAVPAAREPRPRRGCAGPTLVRPPAATRCWEPGAGKACGGTFNILPARPAPGGRAERSGTARRRGPMGGLGASRRRVPPTEGPPSSADRARRSRGL